MGLVLLGPLILASWFPLPLRRMLVWPYWFAVLFHYWITTPEDPWVIELLQGLRLVMIDTLEKGRLEGPNGFSAEVKKIGVVGVA